MSAASKHTALATASTVLIAALALVGSAGGRSGPRDSEPPSAPTNLRLTSTTPDSVDLAWDPATDDVGLAGYYVYVSSANVDWRRTRVTTTAYTARSLQCGTSVDIWVVAVDRSKNQSPAVAATVSTAPCSDLQPPTAPVGFRQQATTQNEVVLAWDRSTDNVGVVGYSVYRDAVPVQSASDPNVTVRGLLCGSIYRYDVDAFDAAGNRSVRRSAWLQTAACSDGEPPTAPTGLSVTSHGPDSLSLAWSPSSDNVGVAGYRVSLGGAEVTTMRETRATLTSLACDTTYSVAVDAFDEAGNRSSSETISAATDACVSPPPPPPGDTTPPSAPTALAASDASQTSVALTWNASSDNVGVTGYDVYRNGDQTASVSSTSSNQTGLTCGTAYSFTVAAKDAAGNRSVQAQVNAFTAPCSPPPPPTSRDTSPPSQPIGLAATASAPAGVSLIWTPSTDNVGVAGYGVYRDGTSVSTTPQPGATVTGLTCGTAYTFEVDAYDAAGNHSSRAALTVSTSACPDAQPPTTPANVTASSRTATSIALSWSPSSDNVGVTSYGLYRAGAQVGTSNLSTGIFAGLTCNTNYTLAVDASDAAGNRSSKTTVMVSTTACPDTTPPSTPGSLNASNITQTSLTLAWTASSDNVDVTGYDVYRNGTKVETTGSTTSNQSGLGCGTSYALGVEAFDAAGLHSSRATVNATTSPCSPPPTASCPGTSAWSACFDANWNGWNGFNGSPNGPIPSSGGFTFQNTYFSFAANPSVTGQSFKAYADNGAVAGGQAGERTMVVVWPYRENPGDGYTQAQQGQEQWYRDEIYFPAGYQPVANTSFNWVWEIHNWPDNACCAQLALGVVTNAEDGGPAGGERLSLRILGGGDSAHPIESTPGANAGADPTPAGYRRTWVRGPSLQRDHWYDVLVHVKWDYTNAGHVDWYLDNQLLVSYDGPTLFWYSDNNTSVSGTTPGPGMGYLMLGNYRQTVSGQPPSSVYHDSVFRGPTRASVGG